jgi:hypothetical protein
MTNVRLLLAAAVVAACGSRTGFDLGAAAVVAGDAGTGSSSPCGAQPTVLASGQPDPVDLAVDATSVYWTTQPIGNPSAGSVVKVPIAGGPTTTRVPKTGGTPQTIATGQRAANGIAADGTSIYWVTAGTFNQDGTVMKAPKAGGQAVTLASSQASPGAIAVDDHCVYWVNVGTSPTNDSDGAVVMMAK